MRSNTMHNLSEKGGSVGGVMRMNSQSSESELKSVSMAGIEDDF